MIVLCYDGMPPRCAGQWARFPSSVLASARPHCTAYRASTVLVAERRPQLAS
eukprot:COSAG01_NODE_21178_length_914_cov_3.388957_2_plen_51_part_01